MSCLFIGELIGTPFRDGHNVVYDVGGGVEVVGDAVVDLVAADTAWWFGTGDCFAVAIANCCAATCAHCRALCSAATAFAHAASLMAALSARCVSHCAVRAAR